MELMDLVWAVVRILAVLVVLLGCMAYLTLFERRVVGFFQLRPGPNRVGWQGLLQPIADGVKLLFKQEIVPRAADRFVYFLAPAISLIAAFMLFAVVPIQQNFFIADVNVALIYVLAMSSLGTYGIILAGWSSGSKYSLLGGLRSCSQMISYELALGLSIIPVVLYSGTFSLNGIVEAQTKFWPNVFSSPVNVLAVICMVASGLIFLISIFAETNRAPFDLPEAENELVAGYHTEYSSMKFAMFFLGEYVNIIAAGAMTATLFLGGWAGPQWFGPVSGLVWFSVKTVAIIFFFVWVRATLPRFRYDQLMKFGWLILLPIALANVIFAGTLMVFGIGLPPLPLG
ncbi:MAG: NADH-quinone oxidoreductase subunit NuoH [bacterium]|jgi:NADH-quinone oxidoreductase subunit H